MSINKNKYNCCGCSACESVCGHNAIKMKPDSLGFLIAHVDHDKCTECGLCEKCCNFKSDYRRYNYWDAPKVYLARLKNENQLMKSQSGGVFYAVASTFIKSGGVVFGASFTDDWDVHHQKVETLQDLEKLRMSKYVQSNTFGIYRDVLLTLREGKRVLFSGTPCQVAAAKSFIPEKMHDNLFCIDIICHGVPSPKIWRDNINFLQTKRKTKIKNVNFRDKRFGWHGAIESYLYDDGKEEFRRTSNLLYFSGLTLRDCCAKCPYTNLKRTGDLTVGDFWGLPKNSKYEDDKGTSLCLINSTKGEGLLQECKDMLIIESRDINKSIQPQLIKPSSMNKNRKQFVTDYEKFGFKYIAKKYGDLGWHYKFKQMKEKIKIILKRIVICK